MDKFGTKPLHRLTRHEAIIALRELRQQFCDYKFRTDQRIRDLEGEITVYQAVEEAHLPSCNGKNITPARNFK